MSENENAKKVFEYKDLLRIGGDYSAKNIKLIKHQQKMSTVYSKEMVQYVYTKEIPRNMSERSENCN